MAEETMVITFEVLVNVLPEEVVCLSGDLEELGNWNHRDSVFLQQKESATDLPQGYSIWRCEVTVPRKSSIKYRYFTCFVPENSLDDSADVIISRWEASYEPRVYVQSDDFHSDALICDKFGSIDGNPDCTSKGWLTKQTEVNLRLVPGCITLWNEDLQITYIKCTPFEMGRAKSQQAIQPWSKLLTYTLNKTDYVPTLQVDGCAYHPDDVMMFKVQVHNTENLGFKFDFYGIPLKYEKSLTSETYIGYSCIMPSALKDSLGKTNSFISSVDQKMEGEFKVRYSIIIPLAGYQCSLKDTFRKSLNYKNYPLNVGHRGMGSSFDITAPVMENTIASFNAAAQYGAQCVEMDVHLTKDLEPVIYHDFAVHVAMEKKNRAGAASNHARMSVKNLTLDQLQSLKLYHPLPETSGLISISEGNNSHEMPFPTLLDCLNEVQEDIGFFVELKYPSELENGKYEDSTMFDANQFSDVILSLILKHCGNRKIVLSTFEPDLCIMLHLKQNKFPVMFLTQGKTEKWPPFKDPRTQTVETGISFTKAEGLFAICPLTENLLKNEDLIKMCHENNLPILSWGMDNDNHNNLRILTEKGLVGLIYNRMDVYGPGAPLKNV